MTDRDIIAIGCGPANLSLAALIEGTLSESRVATSYLCLERKPDFSWHPGQLFPGSRMLSEFTRDLVTPVDPQSPYSFLAYLKRHGRLTQYMNSGVSLPTRVEFTAYMSWVVSQLSSIRFSATVNSVAYDRASRQFVLSTQLEGGPAQFRAQHVVVGIGDEQYIPEGWDIAPAAPVIHVTDAMPRLSNTAAEHIAIVGGGQSAAELIAFLTGPGASSPTRLDWWFADLRPAPLDTGHFTREFFSAAYETRRSTFAGGARPRAQAAEHQAEHGVSPATLGEIYERLYLGRYFEHGPRVDIFPATNVETVTVDDDGSARVSGISWTTGEVQSRNYDLVVACTGFRRPTLSLLRPLYESDAQLAAAPIRSDYSIEWRGSGSHKVFLQSRASESHGVGNTALSAVAERNALILNAAVGQNVLELNDEDTLCWTNREH